MSERRLPDLDETGVIVFETIPDNEPDELGSRVSGVVPTKSEWIDADQVTREDALEVFASGASVAYGINFEGKIAHISDQIRELRGQMQRAGVSGFDEAIQKLQNDLAGFGLDGNDSGRVDRLPEPLQREVLPLGSAGGLESLARLASLDERINAIEHRLGNNGVEVPLSTRLEGVERMLSLLTPSAPAEVEDAVNKLDLVSARLNKHNQAARMDQLYRQFIEEREKLQGIQQVATRLKSLEALHIQAAASQGAVKDIQVTLASVKADIRTWTEKLERLAEPEENEIYGTKS